ncbi:MAG: hypothetical protein WBK08_12850 [Nitrospira sp.]|nr:MAG: hypothetical protein E8D42_11770 [Nitrospira sp.]
MVLVRYLMILAFSLSSAGIASAQEHSPVNAVLPSPQTLATLTTRAEFFEAKAQLATQCAKGLRLVQSVMNLAAPNDDEDEGKYDDEDEARWFRETYLLLRMWFTKEQQDEWYFAGKEFAGDSATFLEGVRTKAEAMDKYKRVFALIMNAQVAALEKLSDDLDARMIRIQETRSAD